ncbi:MAG: cytochrome c-type biogenesis protein CcmH [Aggregatilineales bacterium]
MHRLLLLVGLLLLLGAAPIYGQDPPECTQPVTDDDVNRVSRNLYCPVCENLPLRDCPTEACERWRDQVRELLACGATEQEVREYFVARFGQVAVGMPTDPALQLFTVVLPLFLVGAFGIWVALTLWRWRAGQVEPTPKADSLPDDPHRAALERELNERF